MAIVNWQPWMKTTWAYTTTADTNSETLEINVPAGPFDGSYWEPPAVAPAPFSDDEVNDLVAEMWKKSAEVERRRQQQLAKTERTKKLVNDFLAEKALDDNSERQRWLTGKCVLCGRKRRRWFKFLGAYCRLCHPAPAFVMGSADG